MKSHLFVILAAGLSLSTGACTTQGHGAVVADSATPAVDAGLGSDVDSALASTDAGDVAPTDAGDVASTDAGEVIGADASAPASMDAAEADAGGILVDASAIAPDAFVAPDAAAVPDAGPPSWHIEHLAVDPHANFPARFVLDHADHPHIAYNVGMDPVYHDYTVTYGHFDGTSWTHEPVAAPTSEAGQYIAIALDSSETPHIAYYNRPVVGGDATYAHRTSTGWSGGDIASGGEYIQILVDATDAPHVLFSTDGGASGPTHAVKHGTWVSDSLSDGQVDARFATVDGHTLVACWVPQSSSFDQLRCARRSIDDTAGWTVETISVAPAFVTRGSFDMALDASGEPHMVTCDSVRHAIKYVHRVAGAWAIETAAMAPSCESLSIALDSAGEPHVTYQDTGEYDLAYAARSASGAWSFEIVDAGGFTGASSQIHIDSHDHPHILYRGPTTFHYAVFR